MQKEELKINLFVHTLPVFFYHRMRDKRESTKLSMARCSLLPEIHGCFALKKSIPRALSHN